MAKLSSRLTSALAPLGIVALVAGCGGGSMVSGSNGATTFVPPGSTGPSASFAGKATLTLYVPARKSSAGGRQPRYISPATSTIRVQVAQAGAPSPWPNPTYTSVPTPGPTPTGGATPTPIPVTMTVAAPLGSAQFAVDTYDASGALLSGITSTPVPISNNAAANTIALTLNASAQCFDVNHAKSGFALQPFANQGAAQTATFVVSPCDIDGYPIPAGQQLANQLSFTNQNPNPGSVARQVRTGTRRTKGTGSPVTFSPSVITQGGDTTVTMTYAAGANTSNTQFLVASNSGTTTPANQAITADPISYIFVSNQADKTISVIETDFDQTLTGNFIGTVSTGTGHPGHLAGGNSLNGCAQAAQAMSPNDDGTISILTLPTPNPTSPTPLPSVSTISGIASPVTASYVDKFCNAYVGAGGTLYDMARFLSPLNTIGNNYSNPIDGSPLGTYGYAPITAVTTIPGAVYLGLGNSSGYLNNIITGANDRLAPGSAPGADAMLPYDSSHFAVAYHNAITGYLHFALFDSVAGGLVDDTDSGSSATIYGMAEDSGGAIWAVGNSTSLYQWIPGTSALATFPLTHSNPTGLAIGIDGYTYITDAGLGAGYLGSLDQYAGTTYQQSFAVGSNPNSVISLP